MSHGSSTASWTAVLVALAGFTIGGIGLVPDPNWIVFWIGVGLTLVAAPLGKILSSAGYGIDSKPSSH